MNRALLASLVLVVACDPAKSGGPAQSSAQPSATVAPPPPSTSTARPAPPRAIPSASTPSPTFGAANAADVARYDNEKPLPEVEDHVNHDMRVRTMPSTKEGDVILALRAGTPVKKVAKRGQWFLVTFADPKDKSRTLIGWTWEQAFAALSGPGDEKKLCDCWKKDHDADSCDAIAGMAMGECDRTYGDDCKKLVACVQGTLAPTCMPTERLLLPQRICAKTCKNNAGCPNDHVCTDTLGTPSVCVRAQVAE